MKKMQRIVVKVGSNVLTRADGKLDVTRVSTLVDQFAWLYREGYEVVVVSSGSVASGRSLLKVNRSLDNVEQRQLYSAVGQTKLMSTYYNLFREHEIPIGQVLTQKENFSTRRAYLNQRSCMEVMLANGVIPIVNENDTVSVTELMFTDNDELSGLIASMLNADSLVILSNVDGIYKDINTKEVLPEVHAEDSLENYVQQTKSSFGRGGMLTKCNIAAKVASEGIRVLIANGRREHILVDLFQQPDKVLHTTFCPAENAVSNIKKWIAHSTGFTKGSVWMNDKAIQTIQGPRATSVLLVGATKLEGDFLEGDIIHIKDTQGNIIGMGCSSYDRQDAENHLGEHGLRPLIHYDFLYLE